MRILWLSLIFSASSFAASTTPDVDYSYCRDFLKEKNEHYIIDTKNHFVANRAFFVNDETGAPEKYKFSKNKDGSVINYTRGSGTAATSTLKQFDDGGFTMTNKFLNSNSKQMNQNVRYFKVFNGVCVPYSQVHKNLDQNVMVYDIEFCRDMDNLAGAKLEECNKMENQARSLLRRYKKYSNVAEVYNKIQDEQESNPLALLRLTGSCAQLQPYYKFLSSPEERPAVRASNSAPSTR